jgi:hypothetical protein
MRFSFAAGLVALAIAAPAESQAPAAAPALTYADLADLSLAAPVVAHVRLRSAARVDAERAPGLAPGHTRFYVVADLVSLIRGAQGMPARVSYLADLPNSPDGRPAKLAKKSEMIVLAATVPGRPGELRLTGRDSQIPYTPQAAATLRAILTEATRAGAPPAIAGIGKAFHVPGAIPGESETQIFLLAADNRPVSLNLIRRPGEQPIWAVALSEIVDDAAAPPEPNSLLWYRLACTLPRTLPRQSYAEAEGEQAAAIQADYRYILQRLGSCPRTRARR